MNVLEDDKQVMSRMQRYVNAFCGLYAKVARQLGIDRSFVSRVARGERSSEKVEGALVAEYKKIIAEEH